MNQRPARRTRLSGYILRSRAQSVLSSHLSGFANPCSSTSSKFTHPSGPPPSYNGARSRGPVTEIGKRNSSRNSLRHGLLARTIVLQEEAGDRFLTLLGEYMETFKPSTAIEVSLVETMAVARWRQLRVWGFQKTAMDRDMALQDPGIGPPEVRAVFAVRGSSETTCPGELLLRYEIAYDRQFSRALTRLLQLQSRPASPESKPYHPAAPAGHTWKDVGQGHALPKAT